MARQTINTGTIANDGTGDTLRIAGNKINENFVELYNLLGGDAVGASNVSQLTDSGLDILGTSFRTKIGAVDPSSLVAITFPDNSGTVTLNAATQTLTNKTISLDSNVIDGYVASSFVVSNSAGKIDGSASQIAIPTSALVGINDTQTLTNKTFSVPSLSRPNIEEWLADSSGNPVISFTDTTSTRNRIKVGSYTGGTGTPPTIDVLGIDTSIPLNITGKGTGPVRINKFATNSQSITAGSVLGPTGTNITSSIIKITGTAGSAIAIQDLESWEEGTVLYILRQNGTGTQKIYPSSFAQGVDITGTAYPTIDLIEYETVTLVWDGSNWFVTGGEGYEITGGIAPPP